MSSFTLKTNHPKSQTLLEVDLLHPCAQPQATKSATVSRGDKTINSAKWRIALRCATRRPAPARSVHAPASRMPTSAAHPS
eukprot:2887715-Prymnesium_polylepis.1